MALASTLDSNFELKIIQVAGQRVRVQYTPSSQLWHQQTGNKEIYWRDAFANVMSCRAMFAALLGRDNAIDAAPIALNRSKRDPNSLWIASSSVPPRAQYASSSSRIASPRDTSHTALSFW